MSTSTGQSAATVATEGVAALAQQLRLRGQIQGVGFRPFVLRLALALHLTGHVRNTAAGVAIHLEGLPPTLDEFRRRLSADLPAAARIETKSSEGARGANSMKAEITSAAPVCMVSR